jgi:hypothetical protein
MKKNLKTKMTLEQQQERAEAITGALYAAEQAAKVHNLILYTPYWRGQNNDKPTRRPELMVLADAMSDRAADMLLEAFDGHVNGKRFGKPKKAPK